MSRRASIETNEENPKLPIAKEEIHQPMVTIGVMTKVESWLTQNQNAMAKVKHGEVNPSYKS